MSACQRCRAPIAASFSLGIICPCGWEQDWIESDGPMAGWSDANHQFLMSAEQADAVAELARLRVVAEDA